MNCQVKELGTHRANTVGTVLINKRLRRLIASAVVAVFVMNPMCQQPVFANCSDAPGPGINWSGCSKQLLVLEGKNMNGANLSRTYLSGTIMNAADLQGADFSFSELPRTSFKGANLSGANFDKALASRADFSSANLTEASLVKAEFYRVSFLGAALENASMSDGDFHRCDFTDANLSGADLHQGTGSPRPVQGDDLAGTNLTNAFLYRSRIGGADRVRWKALPRNSSTKRAGDATTRIPEGLSMPARWPCGED